MEELPILDEYRDKEFSNLLEELCKNIYSHKKIKELAERFVKLYDISGGCYHIPYGVVSGNITLLYNEFGKDYVDQISQNLNSVAKNMHDRIRVEKSPLEQRRYTKAYQSVVALQDYIEMETIRVDQMDRQFKLAEDKAAQAFSRAQTLNDDVTKLLDDTEELAEEIKKLDARATTTLLDAQNVSEDAKNLKSDVITILTIFAAIILAFTGGLTVLGDAVVSIESAPLYQVLLVTLFCIDGLFNTIYLLLNVVARICGKNLSMDCKHGECKECNNKEKCKGFRRFVRRSPYVVGFNILLILAIGAVVLLNFFGRLGQ